VNKIRVLFLPPYFGFPSHFIPLVKLYQRMSDARYDVAFVLPRLTPEEITAQKSYGFEQARYYYDPEFLARFELPVLDVKQQFSAVTELAAYRKFAPDLIVDDSNLTTALARQIRRLPRLTIARTGIFDGSPGPHAYAHSLSSVISTLRPLAGSTFVLPNSIDSYFEAEAHLVPATPLLEPMPGLRGLRTRSFYCGPLLLDEEEEKVFASHEHGLVDFFRVNRERKIAYVTFGIGASRNPHSSVWGCLHELLGRGWAVVTNMMPTEHTENGARSYPRENCFFSRALPMHFVCSRVDLVIHVCGSATYHYPILHRKPAITIGTQCRDREDVAQRLCALGLSHHLPAPGETADFQKLFVDALDRYESNDFPFDAALRTRLEATCLEIESTAARFDIDAAIDAALSAAAPAARSHARY
jgi:UDP:flavonoid glycosyltransferase YjiC (YdhE family)